MATAKAFYQVIMVLLSLASNFHIILKLTFAVFALFLTVFILFFLNFSLLH
jgi:hypothetical protein